MNKILKILGIVIGCIIAGTLLVSCAGMFLVGSAVNDVAAKDEQENAQIKEIADKIDWQVEMDDYSTYIVGEFTNTTDEPISYIEFNCKLYDSSDVCIEKTFANESDIAPGETRKVEILLTEDNFARYEIEASNFLND